MADASRKRFLFLTFGVVIAVIGMFLVIGWYQGTTRVKREKTEREQLAALEEQLPSMEKLRRINLVYKDRIQPLDSVARSKIRELSGRRKLYGVDPVLAFLSLCFDGKDFGWEEIPLLHVQHGRNKEWLGMASVDKLATPAQVRQSEEVNERIYELQDAGHQNIAKVDSELLRLKSLVRELDARFSYLFKCVPPTTEQIDSDTSNQLDWHLPNDAKSAGHDPEKAEEVAAAFDNLVGAWKTSSEDGQRSMELVNSATDRFVAACTALQPSAMLPAEKIDAEIGFNSAKPFNYASYFYIAAALLMLFGLAFGSGAFRWIAVLLATAGFGFNAYGFYLRTTLGFGVTITNLYESMVALAATMMLICIILDLVRGGGWGILGGGMSAFVLLQVLDLWSVKFDDAIGGTIAVLANNIWVHIHVPIVMAAYGSFFAAFVFAAAALVWILFVDRQGRTAEVRDSLKTATVCVNVGAPLMFAGLILGGIWAQDSWGRFWGWDPKETWALILFLYYMVIIHGRFTKWMNPFWAACMMFTGGNVLLWTYYGTNELLSGLHSYANSAGDGGFWENFIHERNRWFVWTSGVMLGITMLSILFYQVTGGKRGPAPAAGGEPAEALS